jgi:hypothetical protein
MSFQKGYKQDTIGEDESFFDSVGEVFNGTHVA